MPLNGGDAIRLTPSSQEKGQVIPWHALEAIPQIGFHEVIEMEFPHHDSANWQ
jgi:hypothetical protein